MMRLIGSCMGSFAQAEDHLTKPDMKGGSKKALTLNRVFCEASKQ